MYWILRRLSFLLRDITNHACKNLNAPGVVGALARYIVSRLERKQPPHEYDDGWNLDAKQRRAILSAIVPNLASFDENASGLLFGEYRLIESEDFDWLIQQAVAAPPESNRWARLVGKVAHCMSPLQFDAAIAAARVNAALAAEFFLGVRICENRFARGRRDAQVLPAGIGNVQGGGRTSSAAIAPTSAKGSH